MSFFPKVRRLVLNRHTLIAVALVYVLWLFALGPWSGRFTLPIPYFLARGPARIPNDLPPLAALQERIPCYGPRGLLLSDSPDDALKEVKLDREYPLPFFGSYEALGLDQTWMTFDGRYGPYGYGEDSASYNRTKVDWNKIDWGKLQNDCFQRNAARFPPSAKPLDNMRDTIRFGYRNKTHIPEIRRWHDFESTRRTAVVLRAWRGYEYKPEDMWYLRSMIAETSLRTGGEYQVIILVDMKDFEPYIFSSKEAYAEGLKAAGVPPELQSIAILWDDRLLESWYPDITEHRTMWQVYQPMQLLALHYPEFDHFWQFELDMRFTGDAGKFLDRINLFARNEPRKQALERSLFQHMQRYIANYSDFFDAVDHANKGSAYIWGPLRIPEIKPIGPVPPVANAKDENFQWGIGEDADVIVTSMCNNASAANAWVFRDWIGGFEAGLKTPRFVCPPAITRASRTLFLAIHEAQVDLKLRVPSEATPPSFAIWHGLKLSFPQHPVFFRSKDDPEAAQAWWKGGPANSTAGFGPQDLSHPRGMGLSWWWESDWPRQLVDAWEGRQLEPDAEFPWILEEQPGNDKDAHKDERDGAQVYIPNMMLHPVKHHKD